jgi:hypothetical protein
MQSTYLRKFRTAKRRAGCSICWRPPNKNRELASKSMPRAITSGEQDHFCKNIKLWNKRGKKIKKQLATYHPLHHAVFGINVHIRKSRRYEGSEKQAQATIQVLCNMQLQVWKKYAIKYNKYNRTFKNRLTCLSHVAIHLN